MLLAIAKHCDIDENNNNVNQYCKESTFLNWLQNETYFMQRRQNKILPFYNKKGVLNVFKLISIVKSLLLLTFAMHVMVLT